MKEELYDAKCLLSRDSTDNIMKNGWWKRDKEKQIVRGVKVMSFVSSTTTENIIILWLDCLGMSISTINVRTRISKNIKK